jgi:hemerythrin-like domain-containing protein
MTTTSKPIEVLDACHQQILVNLDKLQTLLGLLKADDDEALTRRLAGETEMFFSGTSREHHMQEESDIFPPLLKREDDPDLVQAVRTLSQDHNWLELNWSELAPMLRAVEQGEDWVDIEHLEHAIEVFVKLSQDHIALEESMVYPQARAAEMARRLAE